MRSRDPGRPCTISAYKSPKKLVLASVLYTEIANVQVMQIIVTSMECLHVCNMLIPPTDYLVSIYLLLVSKRLRLVLHVTVFADCFGHGFLELLLLVNFELCIIRFISSSVIKFLNGHSNYNRLELTVTTRVLLWQQWDPSEQLPQNLL